jgi:hypothetical protein
MDAQANRLTPGIKSRYLSWLRRVHKKSWLAPFTLFWVTLLAYGIYIPWLGLYGDDWLYLWNYHLLGPGSFVPFVAVDRPFSAWIYVISTAIIGEHIWGYHVLALLLRFLGVLALWWVLRLVWPKQTRQVLTVALLFAIYPGFRQQAIPIEFILHFSVLGMYLASLGIMILAARTASQGKQLWKSVLLELLSVGCAAGIFSIEYFVGLELIRPIVLWLALQQDCLARSQRWRSTFRWYWPFLVLLGGFIVWRVFVQRFEFYQPVLLQNLQANFIQGMSTLARRFFTDLYLSTIGAWSQVFEFAEGLKTLIFSLVLIGFSLVTLGWLVISQRDGEGGETFGSHAGREALGDPGTAQKASRKALPERFSWATQAGILGLVALCVAGIPFWVTGITITLAFPWDRGTLPFMLGASLLLAGILEFLFVAKIQRLVLVILVSISIGAFAVTARTYFNDWAQQTQLIWQLVWRAPQLSPGTMLVTEKIYLDYIQDNGMTPIVNWTYAHDLRSERVPYNVYELENRRNSAYDVDITKVSVPIERVLRSEVFYGSTSEMILFNYRSPSCLRIVRPEDVSNLAVPPRLRKIENLSILDLIIAHPSMHIVPPLGLGTEPQHTWCYYFEKADLARQMEDWPQVVALWEAAAERSYTPTNVSEYEPFIEAFARLKDWDTATQISQLAIIHPEELDGVCAIWHKVELSLAQDSPVMLEARTIGESLGCPGP